MVRFLSLERSFTTGGANDGDCGKIKMFGIPPTFCAGLEITSGALTK